MREELIKSVIKYKLTMASKLLDRMPPAASGRVKAFGKLVCDAVTEFGAGTQTETAPKSGSVPIE
jgi:hypothetical protein